MKIWVVDDSPTVRWMMVKMLGGWGHEVREIQSGQAAVDALGSEKPECIFLDLQMPGMDGYECLQRIKESSSRTRVFILTSMNRGSDKDWANHLGADDYFTKPIDWDRIRVVLEEQV